MLDCQEPSAPDPQLPTGGRLGGDRKYLYGNVLEAFVFVYSNGGIQFQHQMTFHAQSFILTKMIG